MKRVLRGAWDDVISCDGFNRQAGGTKHFSIVQDHAVGQVFQTIGWNDDRCICLAEPGYGLRIKMMAGIVGDQDKIRLFGSRQATHPPGINLDYLTIVLQLHTGMNQRCDLYCSLCAGDRVCNRQGCR